MEYLNKDFLKMSIGFLLIVILGLAGIYIATRGGNELPAPSELTGDNR